LATEWRNTGRALLSERKKMRAIRKNFSPWTHTRRPQEEANCGGERKCGDINMAKQKVWKRIDKGENKRGEKLKKWAT